MEDSTEIELTPRASTSPYEAQALVGRLRLGRRPGALIRAGYGWRPRAFMTCTSKVAARHEISGAQNYRAPKAIT